MLDLRTERERRGLSLEQVSDKARIPRRYLAALEDGDHQVLPPGPFWRGYRRQYLDFLGLDESPDDSGDRAETTVTVPRPAVPVAGPTHAAEGTEPTLTPATGMRPETRSMARLVVGAFLVTLAVVLGLRLVTQLASGRADTSETTSTDAGPIDPASAAERPVDDDAAAVADGRGEVVRLRATEPVRITVRADGKVVHRGTFTPAETTEFRAAERLEVDTEDLTRLSVWYDGERIEPLGNLSQGRRLVFIRDDAR